MYTFLTETLYIKKREEKKLYGRIPLIQFSKHVGLCIYQKFPVQAWRKVRGHAWTFFLFIYNCADLRPCRLLRLKHQGVIIVIRKIWLTFLHLQFYQNRYYIELFSNKF